MKPVGPVAGESLAQRVRAAVARAAEHADEVDRDGRFPHEALAAMRAGRLMGGNEFAGARGLQVRQEPCWR